MVLSWLWGLLPQKKTPAHTWTDEDRERSKEIRAIKVQERAIAHQIQVESALAALNRKKAILDGIRQGYAYQEDEDEEDEEDDEGSDLDDVAQFMRAFAPQVPDAALTPTAPSSVERPVEASSSSLTTGNGLKAAIAALKPHEA